jgi:hypothetical protein
VSNQRRDELAARVAASLATTELSPARVVARAYAIADALLERARQAPVIHELVVEAEAPVDDTPHDPRWELEPRWSRRDRIAADAAARAVGPGLASTRASEPPKRERDAG